MHTNITLLGGGNMARAMVAGLIKHGHAPASITVVDRNAPKCEAFARDYGIRTTADPKAAMHKATVIILAIKPQGIQTLLDQIGDGLSKDALIISIMSGIRLPRLHALMPDRAIIRAMPNTPARVNQGLTLLCARSDVSATQLLLAQTLFDALGKTHIANHEREFEQLTALTGCGPAFVFYLVQAFTEAMENIAPGLDAADLARDTFAGALALMQAEKTDPGTLIAQVAPKGGMTEQAMKVLWDAKLPALFEHTMEAAIARGDALANV